MATIVDDATAREEHLVRLYTVMLHLLAVGELGSGPLTRMVRSAQEQLWPTIGYFGGSQEGFVKWSEPQRPVMRR
jgi:hypothetical protein